MKSLLRVAIATCLFLGLVGVQLAGNAPAALAVGVVPQAGRVYPTGSVLRGKCGPGAWWTKFEVWANGGWHYWQEVGDEGRQGNPSDPYFCASTFYRPGHYRMVYYLDPTDITLASFTISDTPEDPCTDTDTEIVSVENPNGGQSKLADLKGTHLTPGQVIASDQDVEMTLGDNSVIRMTAGSSMSVPKGCTFDQGTTNWKITLALKLGKIWAKVTSQFGRDDIQASTPGATLGVRGTEYWVSYELSSQLTTVHVVSGSVWVRAAGKTVYLSAGQTGAQRGTHPPVAQAPPTPTSPPPGTLLDVSGANDLDRMTSPFTVAGPFTIHSQWSVMPGESGEALFSLNLHGSHGQTSVPFDAQEVSGSKTVVENADCASGCRLEIDAQNMRYNVSVVKGR
jgi:hypothetical protein